MDDGSDEFFLLILTTTDNMIINTKLAHKVQNEVKEIFYRKLFFLLRGTYI